MRALINSNSTLRVRRYRPEDYKVVRRLHEVALRDAGDFLDNKELDADLDDIESVYLNGSGEFLVGECDGQAVAMGALRKTSAKYAEIKRMRVEPAFQGRGFGRQMLDALERRAAALSYPVLHLDTSVRQRAARALYEKSGFKEVGRGPLHGLDSVFYEKRETTRERFVL